MKTRSSLLVLVLSMLSLPACSDAESVDPFPYDPFDAGIASEDASVEDASAEDAEGPVQATDKKDSGTPDPKDADPD